MILVFASTLLFFGLGMLTSVLELDFHTFRKIKTKNVIIKTDLNSFRLIKRVSDCKCLENITNDLNVCFNFIFTNFLQNLDQQWNIKINSVQILVNGNRHPVENSFSTINSSRLIRAIRDENKH